MQLGALAHLLSVAKAKRAIATVHGHLDTRYIEASQHVHDVHDAIDQHSQSWAMRMTELASIVPDTGTEHAPADNSGPEQVPAMGVPPPGSTTHHFITQEGNEAYRAQDQIWTPCTTRTLRTVPQQRPRHGTLTTKLTIRSTS